MSKVNFGFIDMLNAVLEHKSIEFTTKLLANKTISSTVVEMVDKNVPLKNGHGNYNSKIFFYEKNEVGDENVRYIRYAIKSDDRMKVMTNLFNNNFRDEVVSPSINDSRQEIAVKSSVSDEIIIKKIYDLINNYNSFAMTNSTVAATVNAPKRGRGRPKLSDEEKAKRLADKNNKKHTQIKKVVTEDDFVPVLDVNPMDNEISDTVYSDQDVLADIVDTEDEDEFDTIVASKLAASTTKRGRGRPRKNGDIESNK